MKTLRIAVTMACLFAFNGLAEAAQSWSVTGEEVARFDGRVVDLLCALTGDCPQDCGAGRRQLGLLTDDGVLVLPVKNFAPFAGAIDELVEFCGQRVTVDGLFSANQGVRIFAVQFVKPADGDWRRANRFLDKWARDNGLEPGNKAKNSWFRQDPRIRRIIERDGFLGLGPEEDKKFLADN